MIDMYGIMAFVVLIGIVVFVFSALFMALIWGAVAGIENAHSIVNVISIALLFIPIILDIIGLKKGEKVLPILNLALYVIAIIAIFISRSGIMQFDIGTVLSFFILK